MIAFIYLMYFQSDISVGSSVGLPLEPPAFTLHLVQTEAQLGSKVVMKANVIGYPTPVVQWFVDGDRITSSRLASKLFHSM